MAFYCNGKKGVCDTHPVCKRSCKYFDNSGGKHIDDLDGKRITTNADRIRAMSDEELAKIINGFTVYFTECNRSIYEVNCEDCELCELCSLGENKALDWLKQPAEVDNG